MEKTKEKLIKFFKNFDYFGERFTFKMNSEKSYSSPFGGTLFLIFLIYALYHISVTFYSFIRGDTVSKEYDLRTIENPSISLNDHKYFTMAYCIRNSDQTINQYLNQALSFNVYYTAAKLVEQKLESRRTAVPIYSCLNNSTENEIFFKENRNFWEKLKILDFSGCHCINFSNLGQNFTFSSKNDGIEKNYFHLEIKRTQILNNLNDLSLKIFEKDNPKLFIYFPEYTADIHNYTEPLPMKVKIESFVLNPNVTMRTELNFGLLSFKDFYSYTRNGINDYLIKL